MGKPDVAKRWAGHFVSTVLAANEPDAGHSDDDLIALARAAVRIGSEKEWHRLVGTHLIQVLPCDGIVYGWGELSRTQFRLRELHGAALGQQLGLTQEQWETLLTQPLCAWHRHRTVQHASWSRLARSWSIGVDLLAGVHGLDTVTVTAIRAADGSITGFFALLNLVIEEGPVLEDFQIVAPLLWHAGLRVRQADRGLLAVERPVPITPRERQILCWIARGKSDSQIALQLQRSLHTVRNQVRRILTKFGTTNRVSAVLLAHEQGLLPSDAILQDSAAGPRAHLDQDDDALPG